MNGICTTVEETLPLPVEPPRERPQAMPGPRSEPASALESGDVFRFSPAERETLYAEFQPLVRRLIRQYGDDQELRQDLPGEIFRRFCTVLEAYDPSRGIPLRPYLVCNLQSSVYTFVRSQWRRRKREISLDLEIEVSDSRHAEDATAIWEKEMMNQEVLKVLPDAISRLSPRQRMVVISRFYEGRSFEDIAATLGVCPATARSLLRHGLNNLRRHFARIGWV